MTGGCNDPTVCSPLAHACERVSEWSQHKLDSKRLTVSLYMLSSIDTYVRQGSALYSHAPRSSVTIVILQDSLEPSVGDVSSLMCPENVTEVLCRLVRRFTPSIQTRFSFTLNYCSQ